MEIHDDINIKYMGDQIGRNDAVAFVDKVLREKKRLDDRTDVMDGLAGLVSSFVVYIIDDDDGFEVKLEPLDKKQRVVEFVIHKNTRTVLQSLSDLGDVNPEDEDMDFLDDM